MLSSRRASRLATPTRSTVSMLARRCHGGKPHVRYDNPGERHVIDPTGLTSDGGS